MSVILVTSNVHYTAYLAAGFRRSHFSRKHVYTSEYTSQHEDRRYQNHFLRYQAADAYGRFHKKLISGIFSLVRVGVFNNSSTDPYSITGQRDDL
jgi:hypothetical protein